MPLTIGNKEQRNRAVQERYIAAQNRLRARRQQPLLPPPPWTIPASHVQFAPEVKEREEKRQAERRYSGPRQESIPGAPPNAPQMYEQAAAIARNLGQGQPIRPQAAMMNMAGRPIPQAPAMGPAPVPGAPPVDPNLLNPDNELFSNKENQSEYINHLLNAARKQFEKPYKGYKGKRFAEQNRFERLARELSGKTEAINPYLERSREYNQIGAQGFPAAAEAYMNPYNQHVMRNMSDESTRHFNEDILPVLENRFVRQGTHGSKRHAHLAQRAQEEMLKNLQRRQHEFLHAGYGQAGNVFNADQARKMAAAEQEGRLGQLANASRLGDINNLQNVGEQMRGRMEAPYRVAENEHLNKLRHDIEKFNMYKSVMHGIPTAPLVTPSTPKSLHRADYGNLLGRLGVRALSGMF